MHLGRGSDVVVFLLDVFDLLDDRSRGHRCRVPGFRFRVPRYRFRFRFRGCQFRFWVPGEGFGSRRNVEFRPIEAKEGSVQFRSGSVPARVPRAVDNRNQFGLRLELLRHFYDWLRLGLQCDGRNLNGRFDLNRLAMPANFNPDVVAAARRHDAEGLARREGGSAKVAKIVLHRAHLVERLARLGRQQLVEHPFHGVQGERARRKL